MNLMKHLAALAVILGMIVLAIGSSEDGSGGGNGNTAERSAPKTPGKIEAWVMAQQFVEDNLKSPGSADFGGVFNDYQDPDDVVTDLGGGKFRVTAWVDAQNSFGATIRTAFVCELEYAGNDRWRLTDLVFLE